MPIGIRQKSVFQSEASYYWRQHHTCSTCSRRGKLSWIIFGHLCHDMLQLGRRIHLMVRLYESSHRLALPNLPNSNRSHSSFACIDNHLASVGVPQLIHCRQRFLVMRLSCGVYSLTCMRCSRRCVYHGNWSAVEQAISHPSKYLTSSP